MNNNEAFAVLITRIINKLIFLEKKIIIEIGDIKLYPSEVHLMEVIEEDQTINAISMAKKLGISKGAVSQTLSRMETKGIIYKEKDPNNKNELAAHFTKLGKEAIKKHYNMRRSLQNEYNHYLETIEENDKQVIRNFLLHIEGFIERLR